MLDERIFMNPRYVQFDEQADSESYYDQDTGLIYIVTHDKKIGINTIKELMLDADDYCKYYEMYKNISCSDDAGNSKDEYYFIDEFISYCYPYECDRKTQSYGVLKKYMGNKYTREEMDRIIAELVMRHPYVSNSMSLKIRFMKQSDKIASFYCVIDFKNYDYPNQKKGDKYIKFEL